MVARHPGDLGEGTLQRWFKGQSLTYLSLVEVECGGKRMYWTTHVCFSSAAACPSGSFCG